MKFSIVMLDETEYLTEDLQKQVGKFYTVYLFNPDEETYCCELTPSYYLVPIDYTVTTEEVSDELDSILMDAVYQSNPIYVHCRSINRIPDKFKFTSENDFEDEEEAIEYYQGNKRL